MDAINNIYTYKYISPNQSIIVNTLLGAVPPDLSNTLKKKKTSNVNSIFVKALKREAVVSL